MSAELRILGSLEAVDEAGRLLALGGPRARALAALLLVHAGERVSADRLVDELWPGVDPDRARRTMQVHVSSLRAALAPVPAVVHARAGGYVLEVDPERVDARRFERLAADGRGSLSRDPERARALLEEALALWRGDALGELAAEPFAAAEAARLDELRLATLEARLEADLELGRHAEVVAELGALVERHPLREGLHARRMLALYRCGRQAEALEAFAAARSALRDGLGLEPGPELRALQASILRQDAALEVEPPELRARRRLPSMPTTLVGRRDDVDTIAAELRGGTRVLTVVGPGGVGKTRTALQAAHELAAWYADGVVFVDLGAVGEPRYVADAIARALHVPRAPATPVEDALLAHVETLRSLLVLDNFEHVDDGAPLAGRIVAAAARVDVLATSRRPLRIYGEVLHELEPLAPDDAQALFASRARAVRRAFEPTREVAELCERLDRLPLAIELAAARVRDLPVAEMLLMLPRLAVAADGPRDRPDRQRTLRDAIAWSIGLLSEHLARAFRGLGAFAGGWDEAAALSVAGASRTDLDALAESSLLQRRGTRWRLLETVRELALEELDAHGETVAVLDRHSEHVLAVAGAASAALVAGREQAAWMDRLDAEIDDLRAALRWRSGCGDHEYVLALGVALGRFWEWRGHVREGLEWLEAGLAAGGADAGLVAPAHFRAGVLAHLLGDLPRADVHTAEALDAYRALGDGERAAAVLRTRAALAKDQGDLETARVRHVEAAAIASSSGDERGRSSSLMNLADLALARGDHAEAVRLSVESVAVAEALGDPMRRVISLLNLGLGSLGAAEPDAAAGAFAQAAALCGELRYGDGLVVALEGLGAVLVQRQDELGAAALLGASEALRERSGTVLEAVERVMHETTVAALRAAVPAEALAAAWARGRERGLEGSVEDALAAGSRHGPR